MKVTLKTYPKFMALDKFLCDSWPNHVQTERQTNLKLLDDNNINNDTTEKTKTFQLKKKTKKT